MTNCEQDTTDFHNWRQEHAHWLEGSTLNIEQLLAVFALAPHITDAELLDDLVHDATDRHAEKASLDVEACSVAASAANNDGVLGQLAYLAGLNWSAIEILRDLPMAVFDYDAS